MRNFASVVVRDERKEFLAVVRGVRCDLPCISLGRIELIRIWCSHHRP
ncbi:hypothetical protein ACFFQF_02620 [Haladaptatus pallidirubidus]